MSQDHPKRNGKSDYDAVIKLLDAKKSQREEKLLFSYELQVAHHLFYFPAEYANIHCRQYPWCPERKTQNQSYRVTKGYGQHVDLEQSQAHPKRTARYSEYNTVLAPESSHET